MATGRKAAVLVVFREGEDGREVLLMRRCERSGDPWSGQLSFPGGHEEPDDADLVHTALREAREEVGLDPSALASPPVFLGVRSPANRRDLVVSIFSGTLPAGERPVLTPGPEASGVYWVKLQGLSRKHMIVKLPGSGGTYEADGFVQGDLFIWGMTYRILDDMLTGRPMAQSPPAEMAPDSSLRGL